MGFIMKKNVISVLVSIIVAVIATAFVMKSANQSQKAKSDLDGLLMAESYVKKQLQLIENSIKTRLSAFATTIESDRNFSMKYFFENDRSSPDVVDIAGRYMKPMGFDVLKIVSGEAVIVSSGHFPASTGIGVSNQVRSVLSKPIIVDENTMGKEILTFQAKKEFRIADSLFYCVGGIEIDQQFFEELTPMNNVKVFMKHGNEYIGMDGIRSISEIKDNKLIVNDKEYLAASIPVDCAVKGLETFFIVAVEKQ